MYYVVIMQQTLLKFTTHQLHEIASKEMSYMYNVFDTLPDYKINKTNKQTNKNTIMFLPLEGAPSPQET